MSQIAALREIPGCSAERGTQAVPGWLLKLRKWSCEFREVKRGRVLKEEYWKGESCAEKKSLEHCRNYSRVLISICV